MRNQNQLDKWADKMRRRGKRYDLFIKFIERKNKFAGRILRGITTLTVINFRYEVSEYILIYGGLLLIASVFIGIDGFTTGKELKFLLLGIISIFGSRWLQWQRERDLLDLYRATHGGKTEWKKMIFDIREQFLDTIHTKLDHELLGVVIYGRYKAPDGSDKETSRTVAGAERQWENRHGKRLSAICFWWNDNDNELRIEYRRTPGNIYASRFFQTKGFDRQRHEEIKSVVSEEEWSCEPDFRWIRKLGFYTILVVSSLCVTFILWDGTGILAWNSQNQPEEIIIFVRVLLAQGIIVSIIALAGLSSRGYFFPAGVFRIDEEIRSQQEREKTRSKVIMGCLISAITAIFAYTTPMIVEVCLNKEDVKNGNKDIIVLNKYLRTTNLCRILSLPRK